DCRGNGQKCAVKKPPRAIPAEQSTQHEAAEKVWPIAVWAGDVVVVLFHENARIRLTRQMSYRYAIGMRGAGPHQPCYAAAGAAASGTHFAASRSSLRWRRLLKNS